MFWLFGLCGWWLLVGVLVRVLCGVSVLGLIVVVLVGLFVVLLLLVCLVPVAVPSSFLSTPTTAFVSTDAFPSSASFAFSVSLSFAAVVVSFVGWVSLLLPGAGAAVVRCE